MAMLLPVAAAGVATGTYAIRQMLGGKADGSSSKGEEKDEQGEPVTGEGRTQLEAVTRKFKAQLEASTQLEAHGSEVEASVAPEGRDRGLTEGEEQYSQADRMIRDAVAIYKVSASPVLPPPSRWTNS